MLQRIINRIIGDQNKKAIKKIEPIVLKINDLEKTYSETLKNDEDFPKKTLEFKERLKNGEKLEDLLPEAFALVKAACRRLLGKKWIVRGREKKWDMVPFDVQIIGGIVLHQGKIAEMKTGEGKTLVCTMPVYLNALTGRGVYVVTVNDYLANRDSEWMGGLYKFLGLSVGVVVHGNSFDEKKKAYASDITYGTNNEFGFDYLRDNMAESLDNLVQRELNYAIVDEVDSILIDEARTPLIISAPAEESTQKYKRYSQLINYLTENEDFNIDEKQRAATLTEDGIKKMEKLLGVENIYTEAGFLEVHHIEQALKAKAIFKKDTDYVVRDGEVIIVDEFTGRLMPGRRYSEGLHQAIEAKEGVEVRKESKTLATVTFQNYFRLFKKLAGMTGTAATEAEEFLKIYGLETIIIPTNKPIRRTDHQDAIYKNQKAKYLAVVKRSKELYEKGQPVLIGTISIEKSEILSKLLQMHGIPHNVLNAKFHEKEAEIIARAGEKKAVTIATNMAGRGTDIKLSEGVEELGGLYVIGTERHESRRIDNQLRGRSGRQGDRGATTFFVSMEDDLMRLFGGERVQKMMEFLKIPDDMPIENSMISRSIESSQKKVEGRNFDIRKHLVEYDDVINHQREIIYKKRREVLKSENIKNDIIVLLENEIEKIVLNNTSSKEQSGWDYKEIVETVRAIHRNPSVPFEIQDIEGLKDREEIIQRIKTYFFNEYEKREDLVPDKEILRRIERSIYLHIIDALWMEHIDNLNSIRESVSFRGYAQRDPLLEYKQESFTAFEKMMSDTQSNTVNTLFKLNIERQTPVRIISADQPKVFNTNEGDIKEVTSGHESGGSNILKSIAVNQAMKQSVMDNRNPAVARVYAAPKIDAKYAGAGRNDPCPCGSGKKFKKCHGANL
ncbi:preprotein translocase subunit SecA [Candidatus Peregrinibacteria bacterium]|nr:preprotein translocase subunit SecA [Candidatus Peregrinibacteria bacterium]